MITKFHLPIPVSVNALYKIARNRPTLSREAKFWELEASYSLKSQGILTSPAVEKNVGLVKDFIRSNKRPPNIHERSKLDNVKYYVTYCYHFKDNKLRDVGNFEKILSDLLCDHNVMLDDSMIKRNLKIHGHNDKEKPRVEININSIDIG